METLCEEDSVIEAVDFPPEKNGSVCMETKQT